MKPSTHKPPLIRGWLLSTLLIFLGIRPFAQTLPYEITNNSAYPDNQVYVGIVGITDGHVWVDPVTGQVNPMSPGYNTIPGPVINGNQGPGGNGLYADCFRKLSDIPNHVVNIPKIAGCRIMISFESQLYLYFFGHSGTPSGYAAPNLANPTDPNQGIKYELIELTYNDNGLWCNTTRVDSYQYPMGLEVWGNGFYKRVGEIKTHQEILAEWQATAPSEFQSLINTTEGMIHFPTKTSTFPTTFFQSYIDAIWSKYATDQLVFNSGQAGVWRGNVSGSQFIFTRDGDGQVAIVPGKPTTVEAMEGSGVMASGGQWDLVVQAQLVAAITRHAINLNVGSGVLQDFGNTATYYQTWPYNWYSRFFHRSDISYESQTYTFAYDDVFDQSSTVHTPSPTTVRITIGGFAGITPQPSGGVTLYQHCNYGGYAVALGAGNYTTGQLQALGITNNDISSLEIENGYQITLYNRDNFSGTSVTKTATDACLVDDAFNDSTSSVQVFQTSGWSVQIEAENWAVMSGVQTEACSEGGQNVGWIEANDWIVWDVNVPSTGPYTVSYRVASPNPGGILQLEKAGGSPVYGSLGIPNTGGWQNWTTVSHSVSLSAGQQQIAIKALAGGWNINWLKINSSGSARLSDEVKEPSETFSEFKIYPNPASKQIHLTLPKDQQLESFAIFDESGRVMISEASAAQDQVTIEIGHLRAGHYFLSIQTDTGNQTFRIHKE